MLDAFMEAYELAFPIILRAVPFVVTFCCFSFIFKMLRVFAKAYVPEVKVSEEDALYLDIATSISDGSYNMDESVERWADFYTKQQENKM